MDKNKSWLNLIVKEPCAGSFLHCSRHAAVDRVGLAAARTAGTSRVADSRPAGILLLFGCGAPPPEVCGSTPEGLAAVGGASCRPVSVRPAALFPVCCKGLVST